LADSVERLTQADEKNFKFEQGRINELKFMLKLEQTAKAVLDRKRSLQG
jgi:hypothetical protein